MQVTMLSEVRERPRRVAVGEFDGVHLGIQQAAQIGVMGSLDLLRRWPRPKGYDDSANRGGYDE